MNCIDLGGHSGCKIYLIESDDGRNFVRKISKDKDYNSRLQAQCNKQARYIGSKIKAPKVLRSGVTDEDLFFFDMEYVQGITLAEYIRNIEIGKIKGLVDALVENIDKEKYVRKNEANTIFIKKFSDLQLKLAGNNIVIDEALNLLMSHDWSQFSRSFCHGDMTLENIIVKNDELYFIDFLDSFYDSYLMDFGTLLQDVQVMWSYRKDKNVDMNLILRLIVFRDLFIDSICEKNESLVKEVYFALLQKLVRILPYTNDELTWKFLLKKIKLVIKEVA
ncbi:MAG: phosphotransferase [Bacillus sp. (in: firmicutes)]